MINCTWCRSQFCTCSKVPYTLPYITWDDHLDQKYIDKSKLKEEPETKPLCYPHLWLEYIGLNEHFWYCRNCDIKRKD